MTSDAIQVSNDVNPFDEIISLADDLLSSDTCKDIRVGYLNTINKTFDNLIKNIEQSEQDVKKNIVSHFNNEKIEEIIENKYSNKIKKKLNNNKGLNEVTKKKKQQAIVSLKDLKQNHEIKNEITLGKEKTQLEKDYEELINNINYLVSKVKCVTDLDNFLLKENLASNFSISNGKFQVSNIKRFYLKLNKNYCTQIDLKWAVGDQSNKVSISKDDPYTISINSTSCYNWFRTDGWFQKGEDICVDFFLNTPNTAISNFYIGVCNEQINYASHCMCCNIPNVTYLNRSGKVSQGKLTKVSVPQLVFLTLKEVYITMRVLTSEGTVYFSINHEIEYGPYELEDAERYKIVSGVCGTFGNSELTIVNCYYT